MSKWWKNATIIAAIIAALGAITAALIQRQGASEKTPPPTQVEQTTTGAQSPAISDVKGNVTMTNTSPPAASPPPTPQVKASDGGMATGGDLTLHTSPGGNAVIQTGEGTIEIKK